MIKINSIMWALMWALLMCLVVFLWSCGVGLETHVYQDQHTVQPSGKVRLGVDAEYTNITDRGLRESYHWTVESPNCGTLSSSNGKDIIWTAPSIVPSPITCIISATITLKYSDGSLADRDAKYFNIVVTPYTPYPPDDKPPVIKRFVEPSGNIISGTAVSFYMDAEDPEKGLLKYYWSSSCGTMVGGGPAASLKAPIVSVETICVVSVIVEDPQKSTTSASAVRVIFPY